MCEHNANVAGESGADANDTAAWPGLGLQQWLPKGSRRRRLWDLPASCHCPVVGVCLPLASLRQIGAKTLRGALQASDYDVHVSAVAECGRRNALSEALQRALEQRHARAIALFKPARSAAALAQLWTQALAQGDAAGAFWAALTHPYCELELQERLCRDMHMLQHQSGAGVRADLARLHALQDENALLMRELGRAQERSTRMMSDKSAELEQLGARLSQARIDLAARDQAIAQLNGELAALKAAQADPQPQARLQKRFEQMAARYGEFEARVGALRRQLAAATRAAAAPAGLAPAEIAPAAETAPARTIPITLLQHRTVLCVGGRSGNLASYRDVVERVGARFAHHDGGLEDKQNALDASLAAADLVICQTGCISHNAYWKVKDFCKRTGKRCVYVENPSASSLARSLAQFSGEAAATAITGTD